MSRKLNILFIVLIIAVLPGVASDIYAPSLPAVSHQLMASVPLTQWTMAIYMLGLAISQFLFGPLSDAFGRKRPLMLGLAILVFGSVLCVFSSTISVLLVARFIQALGAGACAVIWRTVFRDSFTPEEMAKYVAYLAAALIFVVPAAPVIGGYFEEYIGWRASFVFVAVCALVVMLCVNAFFSESSTTHHPSHLKLTYIKKSFGELLRNRIFMGYSVAALLTYGAFFSWAVSGPILLVKVLGVRPATFGWLTLLTAGIPMFIASKLQARFIGRVGMLRMLYIAWFTMCSGGALMCLGHFIFPISVYAIIIPLAMVFLGAALVFPNTFAIAFKPFGHISGFAGSLYGSLQILGGAFSGVLIAHLPDTSALSLSIVLFVLPLLALLLVLGVEA